MNKEQLIEEMGKCKVCYQRFGKCPLENKSPCTDYTNAENMYERGYRKVPDGAVILTPEERDEELKACNEKQAELEAKIEILKIQNNNLEIAFDRLNARSERLEADNKALEMWNDAYTEENEKLKAKNIKFLQVIKDFAKKHCNIKCKIAKRHIKDFAKYLKGNAHISIGFDIIKGVGVREYRYFDDEIDECVKEYENDN